MLAAMDYITDTHQHDFSAIEAIEKEFSAIRRAGALAAAAAAVAARRAALRHLGKAIAFVAVGIGAAVCLILLGVSFLNPPPPPTATSQTAHRHSTVTAPPAPKVMSNLSEFHHVQVDDDMIVTTGWHYPTATKGVPPDFQWCYAKKNLLAYHIARNGVPVVFDPDLAGRAGLTRADVQRALPACHWFSPASPATGDQ
jgi:hypothetical protein